MTWILWHLFACRNEIKTPSTTEEDIIILADLDGDGYLEDEDCDDNDYGINPGQNEICDGVDNNCDGQIDEGVNNTYFLDDDGDGFGNQNAQLTACDAPDNYVPNGNDCDDSDRNIYPSATEICDGVDNDCDSFIDEDLQALWYEDVDGDGFGNPEVFSDSCLQPEGYTDNNDDCDDDHSEARPGGTEICDGLDNDCDNETDEDVGSLYYVDIDEDGWGDSVTTMACEFGPGLSIVTGDCDDIDPLVNPAAAELCNDNTDNNCNGDIDEDSAINASTFYLDDDGDSFGDENNTWTGCVAPANYVNNDFDCDDVHEFVFPLAAEICDGLANNCASPNLPLNEVDNDNDGYVECSIDSSGWTGSSNIIGGDDCNDSAAQTHPNANEICDGIANNCSNVLDSNEVDDDNDGFVECSIASSGWDGSASVVSGDDCDDSDSFTHPYATEICDGLINNCNNSVLPITEVDNDGDGYVECSIDSSGWDGTSNVIGGDDCDDGNGTYNTPALWYFDDDGDGFGDAGTAFTACVPPPNGYVLNSDDCDDSDATVFPNAAEICDGQINDCNASALPNTELDVDNDGYVECTIDIGGWDGDSAILGGDDCDSNAIYTHPNATEICDGQINDCNSSALPNTELDVDNDGYVECTFASIGWLGSSNIVGDEDCDDNDFDKHPNAIEVCSGPDLDCDNIEPDFCASCLEIKQVGSDIGDGVYTIDTTAAGEIDVYCDMTTNNGGWTLVQRTIWDYFGGSSQLMTTYAFFYANNIGNPAPGNAHRLSGQLWDELNVNLDHMLRHTPRDLGTGNDCGALYYIGNNGAFSTSSSGLSVSGFSSNVNFFSDNTFDAYGTLCPTNYQAVPWFYTSCCTTCPTFKGSYWTDEGHPMASYADSTPDIFGNTSNSTCPSGAAISSSGYEGMNSMEYYLR